MKTTIITVAACVIALVLTIQLTWSIVNQSNTTNAKVDGIIQFINNSIAQAKK